MSPAQSQRSADQSKNINKAIDPYLPLAIRENSLLTLEDLIRSRVLACCLVSSIAATFFSFLICTLLHIITHHDFSIPMMASFICLIVICLNFLFFYKSGKLDASAILYSLSFFIICVVAIVVTGGFKSPVKQILIVCPVLSFLISGRHEGFYNAVLVFTVGLALLILDVIGFDLLQILPEEVLPYLSGLIWLITVVMVVVCLYVYDLLLEDKRDIKVTTE